jgi:hypothetical protein
MEQGLTKGIDYMLDLLMDGHTVEEIQEMRANGTLLASIS